jgi:uncharacterized protein (TIGR02246 family)
VAVIAGSRRPHRRAQLVAEWVCDASPAGAELTLVDLQEVGLPTLAEPDPPAFGQYTLAHTQAWAELVDGFDAYVLVTPEYNHSTSPALANALHHAYREWHDKAVAFVGYGVDGGVRAVEHLRAITAELGLAGVGPSVALSIFDDFDRDGAVAPRERQTRARERALDGLLRWAAALRPLRTCAPDHDATDGAEVPVPRPHLSQPAHADIADEATRLLLERLQNGLDTHDADLYDSLFAEDVLWGSPYGQVLDGYAPLNRAHHALMDNPTVGTSRYEVVQSCAPARDLVLAHVRRRGLTPAPPGAPDFSEMALFVLIRRHGHWWLAGGQNTPIRDKPASPDRSAEQ